MITETIELERQLISELTGISIGLLFYAPAVNGFYVDVVIQNMLGSYYPARLRLEGLLLRIAIFTNEYITERSFNIANPKAHESINAYLNEHSLGEFNADMGYSEPS